MKVIVGLGNIGQEYENTRHNVGFMVLDSFVTGFVLEHKFQAYIKKDKVDGEDVLYVKPTTFMNLSGNAVQKIMHYYHVSVEDLFVIHDDLDLEFGTYKLKENSSSGGHNGIKSIIQCLNSNQFGRLKIGISNNKQFDTKDYVLGKFSREELSVLEKNNLVFKEIIYSFIRYGMPKTMNYFNSKRR